jgi:hypothetical protein
MSSFNVNKIKKSTPFHGLQKEYGRKTKTAWVVNNQFVYEFPPIALAIN